MSDNSVHILSRGLCAGALTLACLVTAESCGFPDHTFINDDQFYRTRDGSIAGGATGGGSEGGGSGMGGATGGQPAGGAGGLGTGGRDGGGPPDANCPTGYTCAPLPSGWRGPVAIWSGATGTGPLCSGAFPTSLFSAHANLVVPKDTCPTCTCTPSNASCNTLSFLYDTTMACSAAAAWTVNAPPNGACTAQILGTNGGNSARSAQLKPATGTPYFQGTCTPNQPTPTFQTPTWATDAEGCGVGATGGGCTDGQCVPKPVAPFGAKLCVFQSGIATCPSSYAVAEPSYYEGYTDARTCSTCSCGPVTCGGTVTAYTDPTCTTGAEVLTFDGSCTIISADPTPGSGLSDTRSIRWQNATPMCGEGSSTLLGAPTPDTPITVCCQK